MVEDRGASPWCRRRAARARAVVGQRRVGLVDPGAGGVDDHVRRHRNLSPVSASVSDDPRRRRGRSRSRWLIGERVRVRREPVEDQLDAEPLGIADPGVVVGGREAHRWRQVGPERRRLRAAAEHVPRHGAARRATGSRRRRGPILTASAPRSAGAAAQPEHAEGAVQQAAEDVLDRDRGRQRAHDMRRIAQQRVALAQRLPGPAPISPFSR